MYLDTGCSTGCFSSCASACAWLKGILRRSWWANCEAMLPPPAAPSAAEVRAADPRFSSSLLLDGRRLPLSCDQGTLKLRTL